MRSTDAATPADHASRASYRQGCRCTPCRAANATYIRHRQPAAWVDATKARTYLRHLETLSPGIGVHQAAVLSGISSTHLWRIRTGQQGRVKLTTEAAILAIRPIAAHGQRVNAYRTRDYLRSLKKEGYSESRLSQLLGGRRAQLEIVKGRMVTVKYALRVRGLFDLLTAEA